jgi:hypothetical protein
LANSQANRRKAYYKGKDGITECQEMFIVGITLRDIPERWINSQGHKPLKFIYQMARWLSGLTEMETSRTILSQYNQWLGFLEVSRF